MRIRAFEDFYVKRYWDLMDRLSLDALRGRGSGDPLNDNDEKAVLAYMLLCEDELDLRAWRELQRRIDRYRPLGRDRQPAEPEATELRRIEIRRVGDIVRQRGAGRERPRN